MDNIIGISIFLLGFSLMVMIGAIFSFRRAKEVMDAMQSANDQLQQFMRIYGYSFPDESQNESGIPSDLTAADAARPPDAYEIALDTEETP